MWIKRVIFDKDLKWIVFKFVINCCGCYFLSNKCGFLRVYRLWINYLKKWNIVISNMIKNVNIRNLVLLCMFMY